MNRVNSRNELVVHDDSTINKILGIIIIIIIIESVCASPGDDIHDDSYQPVGDHVGGRVHPQVMTVRIGELAVYVGDVVRRQSAPVGITVGMVWV